MHSKFSLGIIGLVSTLWYAGCDLSNQNMETSSCVSPEDLASIIKEGNNAINSIFTVIHENKGLSLKFNNDLSENISVNCSFDNYNYSYCHTEKCISLGEICESDQDCIQNIVCTKSIIVTYTDSVFYNIVSENPEQLSTLMINTFDGKCVVIDELGSQEVCSDQELILCEKFSNEIRVMIESIKNSTQN